MIGWSRRGGGDDDDDPAMATRPTRPPSGTTAAADALYRFAPAPANAAAACAAAPKRRVARSHQPLRRSRFELRSVGPTAQKSSRDRRRRRGRRRGRRERRRGGEERRASRTRVSRCASALAGAGDPITTAPTRRRRDATATEREHGFNLCGACFFSGVPGRHVLRVVRAPEVVDAAGAEDAARMRRRTRTTATTIGRTKRR